MDQCRAFTQNPTCRWVKEITRAIWLVCPERPPVSECSSSPLKDWQTYLASLQRCARKPRVLDIIEYRVDYNEILDDHGDVRTNSDKDT